MKLIFCDNTLWGLVNFRGEVMKHFAQKGHDVVLVAPEKDDKQMQTNIPEGVRYIPVRMKRTSFDLLSDWKYYRQMQAIFKSEKPDYIFNYTIKPNIYGTMAAHSVHCPSTAMMPGLGYIFINNGLKCRMARSFYRFGLRHTKHLFVLNAHNRQLAIDRKMCPENKILLLEGGEGINMDHFAFADNVSDHTTFLYVGRILWDKGYDELSRAARIVKERYPDVSVELLGSLDPSYPNSVPEERLRADEKDGAVKYLGFTKDMQSVYQRKGIVMILPSYGEGFNRALMEACGSGKPIITTDLPGCREAVDDGQNGYIVPVRNAEALAEAMLSYLALSPDEKRQMSLNSRRKAETLFDVRNVIKVYESILQEDLGKN